jgi:lipopolysaccharide export system protein LptC
MKNAPATPTTTGERAQPRRFGSIAPRLARRHSAIYSRFVALMKIVLPATAVGLVLLVLLWPRFNAQEQRFTIPKVVVKPEDLENLKMQQPRFVGVDQQDQPFTVTARLATQAASGSALTELDEPKGDISLKDGSWIAVEASHGVYDKQGETLDLTGTVTLFHDRGYELHTEHARVSFAPGTAAGDKPVRGQGPDVELSGAGFRLEGKGTRIFLTGESRVVLYGKGGATGALGTPSR